MELVGLMIASSEVQAVNVSSRAPDVRAKAAMSPPLPSPLTSSHRPLPNVPTPPLVQSSESPATRPVPGSDMWNPASASDDLPASPGLGKRTPSIVGQAPLTGSQLPYDKSSHIPLPGFSPSAKEGPYSQAGSGEPYSPATPTLSFCWRLPDQASKSVTTPQNGPVLPQDVEHLSPLLSPGSYMSVPAPAPNRGQAFAFSGPVQGLPPSGKLNLPAEPPEMPPGTLPTLPLQARQPTATSGSPLPPANNTFLPQPSNGDFWPHLDPCLKLCLSGSFVSQCL